VRDVLRCLTVLHVLEDDCCAGDDGDLQISKRASDEDYNLGAAVESAAL